MERNERVYDPAVAAVHDPAVRRIVIVIVVVFGGASPMLLFLLLVTLTGDGSLIGVADKMVVWCGDECQGGCERGRI